MKFPVFEEYKTVDQYWQKVFENCSKGRFPRKSGYDPNKNAVWFRDKEVYWYTLTGDNKKDQSELKKHFQTHLKMKSEKDMTKNREQFNKLKNELDKSYTGEWKTIKKKNIKDSLIRQYILDLQETHNLTNNQTIELSKLIRQAILFGWITQDHIKYSEKDRVITGLTNLEFTDGEFILKKKITKSKREYIEPKNFLLNLWRKK